MEAIDLRIANQTRLTMSNQKKSLRPYLSFPCFFLLCLWAGRPLMAKKFIPVGVVLDLNSSIGSMANSCIWIAYQDFYKHHPHYKTRLDLRTRDSQNDVVRAASAALDLINNEKVHAIIGPITSGQARFVIELGRKAQVPIISFSATSPSLSTTRSEFFIRTAQDDSSQVKAIAALVEAYGWREVILIYEDTEYGKGLITYLTDALEEVNTRVPYRSVIDPNSQEPEIMEELERLKHKRTRIFLVHMTSEHGAKFFQAAMNTGMMTEGFAWIITEGLSAELDPMGPEVMDSMQGVLGVRPMVPNTKRLEDFKKRWKASVQVGSEPPLTLFGFWAYDTVWALAMAAEAKFANSTQNFTFLNKILTTKFSGLSGYFNLSKGQLEPSELEVFNVVGRKERIIGNWSQQRGVFRDGQSNAKEKLKQPIWPGDTIDQPTKLRIGVPIRKGFNEFMKVERQFPNSRPEISGFAIDVFLEVIKVLPFPFPYEFLLFEKRNGTYNDLILEIENKRFDVVVGDVTIVANRTEHADFTLPYSESGVRMVVLMKNDDRQNMWIFLKPLSCSLWLTTIASFILTGFIIWLLERRTNTEFQGSPYQQIGMMFWFSFSTLVFAHKERLENNWSRFVLIIWIFVVLIITQSYTASLASMLTVERLQPTFMDAKEIKKNNYSVGYMSGSFVKALLTDQIGLNESNLKPYDTPEEYDVALSNGSNNGGVAAIFDEIPYLKLFLSKYGSTYAMVGPTYQTGGFGFAFPRNSSLVSHFSRAILNVTEDKDKFKGIENKYFSSGIIFEDQTASITSDSPSLTVYSFAGLFIITMVTSLLSFLIYVFKFLRSQWPNLRTIHSEQRSFWSVLVQTAKHFDRKDSSLCPPNRSGSRVYPATSLGGDHGEHSDATPHENHSS